MELIDVWHPLSPHGCKGCGSHRQPHFTRLLCNACYVSARRYGVLSRYPAIPDLGVPARIVAPRTTAGMYTGRSVIRRQRREAAWARQRAIWDRQDEPDTTFITRLVPTDSAA